MQSISDSDPATPSPDDGSSVPPQTSQDIEDFIYLISHDVRASVRALIELPQWIQEDLDANGVKIPAEVATSIELMNRHTGRLDRMLVDLLAFSRVGRLQIPQELSLQDALDDVLQEIRVPPGFSVSSALECDSIRMGERDLPVLLNALITNGIKHHDRQTGQVTISARRESEHVVIRVSDDGPGIEEQFHEHVFSPMTTLRPRDEVEGSGMGLAKVNKIAQFHGGSARIQQSPLGRGLCIEVRLPSGRMS